MQCPPRLAIVVPCYNEQSVLPHTLEELFHYLLELIDRQKIAADSFIYCVDDGSHDQTWKILSEWHQKHKQIKGLKLSRNAGHQNALLAGLMHVKNKVDCAISIDADLQDEVAAIEAMVDQFARGSDIVYGIRQSRQKDSFFKRFTAITFYKLMKTSGADLRFNHADFRLLSQRALVTLSKYKERNLFLRGIFPLMGYSVSEVHYDRKARQAGDSKYPFRKMLALAWDGITSFSHLPLSLILFFGVASFLLSLVLVFFALISKITSHVVPGWTSIMIPLCFMGGVQLLSIGIIGEYIAKIYFEVKRRPRYIKDMELP